MADPSSSPAPEEDGGGGSSYLTISLVVGIPCGVIIFGLVLAIFLMFYLTCKSTSHGEEAEYRHRRFQGISLEQQRQARANRKKKKQMAQRRESGVSGTFNPKLSRSPSTLSAAAARPNPFGLQEWQLRMYGEAGLGVSLGGGRRERGDCSPDTEETELSGDELHQRSRGSYMTGAFNPLMVVQGQDHDPGYDTPPPRVHSLTHTSSTTGHAYQHRHSSEEQETSSDDSMNPYD